MTRAEAGRPAADRPGHPALTGLSCDRRRLLTLVTAWQWRGGCCYDPEKGKAGGMIDWVVAGVLLIFIALVLVVLKIRERGGR